MIESRLENWSRYYRDRFKRECSVLGRIYRAPFRQWLQLHEIHYPEPIDWRDAEKVEIAWKSMSGKYKLILKYTYMYRMPDFVIARKCHVKRWCLDEELGKAKNKIRLILDSNR